VRKLYNPRRDRVDADLCVQQEDGSVRDAAGRLIYLPRSNLSQGSHVRMWRDDRTGEVGGVARSRNNVSFSDPTFDEAWANIRGSRGGPRG